VNAAAGGAAPRDAVAGPPADEATAPGVTTRSRAPKLGTVAGLAKTDALLLSRSVLILAGLLAGGVIIWAFAHKEQALWWNVAWQIGYGQVFIAMAVLVVAQLAAGRPSRNAMADLYASFPTSAATRTLAQLFGLLGAMPASLLLAGGTAAAVEMTGVVGVPSIWALAGGLLLVIAAGAVGIAIGRRFPHPLAGVLGALVLFVPFSQSNRFSGPNIWLYPWIKPWQLDFLPGPLAGYPPVGAHAAELAGIAVLAGIVALVVSANGARAKSVLAFAAILSLAATCLAGAAQLRAIPTADLNRLVQAAVDPVSVQRCTTVGEGRYCLYPDFGPELASIQAPVDAVLTRLPVRPARQLTVAQATEVTPDTTLTHGHPEPQVSQWNAELQRGPASGSATASTIYLPVNVTPSDARFYLALAAGEWAAGFPTEIANGNSSPCLPYNQAREAIAIWLALLATHTPAAQLHSGLTGLGRDWEPMSPQGIFVAIWNYPGEDVDNLASFMPQTTAAGYLLASAMMALPVQRVSQVLKGSWAQWQNWQATDQQLAAALGIPMPALPQPPGPFPTGNQPEAAHACTGSAAGA
jgi:hypothetical protein